MRIFLVKVFTEGKKVCVEICVILWLKTFIVHPHSIQFYRTFQQPSAYQLALPRRVYRHLSPLEYLDFGNAQSGVPFERDIHQSSSVGPPACHQSVGRARHRTYRTCPLLCLLDGAWKAVQNRTPFTVGSGNTFQNHSYGDLVGDELSLLNVAFGNCSISCGINSKH